MQDLTQIISQLPIGVWVASVPRGEAVYTNEAFRDILGMGADVSSQIEDAPRTYGIHDRSGNLYPVEQLPFSRVMSTGRAVVVDDLVIHRPDGERVNVRAFGSPLFGAAGTLQHVSVAFIDVTREVQAELARDRAAAQLSLAVDHSPIVVWSIDKAGIITISQGAALASLGVKSGDLVGQNVFDLYKDHPTISGYIRRVLEGESLQYVVEVGEAVFDTWLTPIRDADGEVVGATGLSNDIRELRKLQAAGIQTDRIAAMGTLAASVAHEINNPLTYILSHAEQIESTIERLDQLGASILGAPAEMRSLIGSLRSDVLTLRLGTQRIATITRELRTFNHPGGEAGVPVDARAAVRSVLQLVGKELEQRARVSLDLQETAPLLAHPSRLVQVVLNLVMNAMQSLPAATVADNEIRIHTETRGAQVVIEVSDSGPGVAPAERERIFEPFVTTKSIGEGSGLGLFVCRNIVRGYFGEVSVHDRPGGGALFRVTLPVAIGLATPVPPPRRQAPEGPAPVAHVLVIDDDAQIANAFAGRLKRAGYRASTCPSGAAGLGYLLSHDDIDLVFCDLMMKGMTGMDLHARLLADAPALLQKVVFMTGGAYSPAARQFLLDHPDDFVEKPFDLLAETRRRLAARQPVFE